MVFIHVIGYPDTVRAVEECRARGQQYVMIQYCLRSTQKPNTADWFQLWEDALLVWSYYDLAQLAFEDSLMISTENLYCSPLGVDHDVFRYSPQPPRFLMMTSGYVAETEGVREVEEATRLVGASMFHLGPALDLAGHVVSKHGILDAELSRIYGSCEFVAGLRRCEGFELPAAEGLCSGARPILFDRPHYRKWYGQWGVFIPEESHTDVVNSLLQVFARGYQSVTAEEAAEAALWFDWGRIIRELYRRVM